MQYSSVPEKERQEGVIYYVLKTERLSFRVRILDEIFLGMRRLVKGDREKLKF